MGTFDCPALCDDLCGRKVVPKDDRYFKNNNIIPDLCRDEVMQGIYNPIASKKADKAAKRALALTSRYFKYNRADDESDAFRHFIWSGLISTDTSPEFAKKITDAHESCMTSDVAQTMDLHNNQVGINAAINLKKQGKLSEENLIREGFKLLKDKKLVVIKSRRGFKVPEFDGGKNE